MVAQACGTHTYQIHVYGYPTDLYQYGTHFILARAMTLVLLELAITSAGTQNPLDMSGSTPHILPEFNYCSQTVRETFNACTAPTGSYTCILIMSSRFIFMKQYSVRPI